MSLPPTLLLNVLEARLPAFNRADFVQAHEEAPPVSIRLNPGKSSSAFENAEPIPWSSGGRYLVQRPTFTLDPLLHAGAYYVQEASSQILEHAVRSLLPERAGLRVLDLCAAPGGKSTLLASLLPDDAVLVSNEVIRTRVPLLAENMGRWGTPNVIITSSDPREFGKVPGLFDLMVVDAPCSGSGLFRKDPAALQHWSQEAVRMCADRQRRILTDAWPAVAEGGVVIYATCSFSPEEDEDVLAWLLEEFDAECLALPMPAEWGFEEVYAANGVFGYRAMPHKVRGEGFFFAAVRKRCTEAAPGLPQKPRTSHDAKAFEQAKHLLADGPWLCVQHAQDGEWFAQRPEVAGVWQVLRPIVHVMRPGLPLGVPSAKGWIPAHEVALSTACAIDIPTLEASRDEALLFLKREDTGLVAPSLGWHIVTYEGLGLGWMKALGNRLNNYLPKGARIRMSLD